jgi:hypothetical protein
VRRKYEEEIAEGKKGNFIKKKAIVVVSFGESVPMFCPHRPSSVPPALPLDSYTQPHPNLMKDNSRSLMKKKKRNLVINEYRQE